MMKKNIPKAGFTLAKIAVGGAILVGLGMDHGLCTKQALSCGG